MVWTPKFSSVPTCAGTWRPACPYFFSGNFRKLVAYLKAREKTFFFTLARATAVPIGLLGSVPSWSAMQIWTVLGWPTLPGVRIRHKFWVLALLPTHPPAHPWEHSNSWSKQLICTCSRITWCSFLICGWEIAFLNAHSFYKNSVCLDNSVLFCVESIS